MMTHICRQVERSWFAFLIPGPPHNRSRELANDLPLSKPPLRTSNRRDLRRIRVLRRFGASASVHDRNLGTLVPSVLSSLRAPNDLPIVVATDRSRWSFGFTFADQSVIVLSIHLARHARRPLAVPGSAEARVAIKPARFRTAFRASSAPWPWCRVTGWRVMKRVMCRSRITSRHPRGLRHARISTTAFIRKSQGRTRRHLPSVLEFKERDCLWRQSFAAVAVRSCCSSPSSRTSDSHLSGKPPSLITRRIASAQKPSAAGKFSMSR